MTIVRNQSWSTEDLTLLLRALHRDVADLDQRLRNVEATLARMNDPAEEATAILLETS
jgi:hypothetical protein